MASRAELKQMCDEFQIDSTEMTMEDMEEAIKEEADKRFRSKKIHHSADKLSRAMRKFLTLEYNYVIYDKDGKELKYDYIK